MMWKSNKKKNKETNKMANAEERVNRQKVPICTRIACILSMAASVALTACTARDKALVLIGSENTDKGATIGETIATATEAQMPDTMLQEPTIVVFVCGAVQNPGVVELPEGSRVADALEAVGGFTEEAECDYVNLAMKLEDARKIYFPTVQEAELLMQEEQSAENNLVNINTAATEQLCTLPGIGEARAEAIISYRQENGDFQSKEDIMKVAGIKQSAYEKLKDYITVE